MRGESGQGHQQKQSSVFGKTNDQKKSVGTQTKKNSKNKKRDDKNDTPDTEAEGEEHEGAGSGVVKKHMNNAKLAEKKVKENADLIKNLQNSHSEKELGSSDMRRQIQAAQSEMQSGIANIKSSSGKAKSKAAELPQTENATKPSDGTGAADAAQKKPGNQAEPGTKFCPNVMKAGKMKAGTSKTESHLQIQREVQMTRYGQEEQTPQADRDKNRKKGRQGNQSQRKKSSAFRI